MGYTKEIINGIAWTGLLRLFVRIISFLRTAIIARILLPNEYGVFAIASLLLSFLEIFVETGVNVVLMQWKEEIDDFIDTAWVVSIVRGIFISLVIVLSSSWVASFFNSPQSISVLFLMSIVPLIRGFINPSVILFQKKLQFEREFYFRSILLFIESCVSIFLILVMNSPLGLVYGLIVSALVEVVLSHLVISPRPKLTFKKAHLVHILHQGKWVTLNGIFEYLFRNADNVVVGKTLNLASLGLYDAAFRISMLPITEVADSIAKVFLPIFLKMQDNIVELRKAFFKTLLYVSLLSFPILIVFYFFSKPIILIILGPKWIDAELALKILGISGSIRAISMVNQTFFLSLKKQNYTSIVTLVSFLGMIISIVPLIQQYGIQGAAIASVLGSVIAFVASFFFVLRIFTSHVSKSQ